MPAADGEDARARRVAARLLSPRARRHASGGRTTPGPATTECAELAARHVAGGHPAGAARVARALAALEPDGWVILSNVPRPGGRGGPTIDHLAVGPGGVVAVDSRGWVGRIEVSRGVVQQNGFWREQETAAVARTAGRVAALLPPQHRTAVHALICVAQHDLTEQLVPPGVHVVGVSGLAGALRALPQRLHPMQVRHVVAVLRDTLVDAGAPEQLTTAELDDGPDLEDRPGAHRELVDRYGSAASMLFVPVTGSALRSVARSAGRRQRDARPWWRTPRTVVARALLVALLLIGALLAGPGVVRSVAGAVGGTPAATVLPTQAPSAPGPTAPGGDGADRQGRPDQPARPDQPGDPAARGRTG